MRSYKDKFTILSFIFAISILFTTNQVVALIKEDKQVNWNEVREELRKSQPNKQNNTIKEPTKELINLAFRTNIYIGAGLGGSILPNLQNSSNYAYLLVRTGLELLYNHLYTAIEVFSNIGGEILNEQHFIANVGGQLKVGIIINNDFTSVYFSSFTEYISSPNSGFDGMMVGFGSGVKQGVTKKLKIFLEYRIGFPVGRVDGNSLFYGIENANTLSVVGGLDFIF
ncbi:MAG: hypothetical protein JJW01_02345 [Alphaproteobacteria bacterium]|nr:hypothetical protein [Rickettsiales bacterium]